MEKLLDNRELEHLMTILEEMDDEELAVKLLAELNASTKHLGLLVLNTDPTITHDDWKDQCVQARKRVEKVVAQIHAEDKN